MRDEEFQETREPIRIDKWLWAARFFKARALAAEAVTGGKVEVNGGRAKSSRNVHVGDSLNIRRGPYEWTVIVKGVTHLRGPAAKAQLLYEETEESMQKREAISAQLRLGRPPTDGRTRRATRRRRDHRGAI